MSLRSSLRHLFIPNERNNFKARLLHIDGLSGFIVLACTLLILQSFTRSSVLGIATDISIDRLLQLTNEARSANNLPPLSLNERLNDAARRKAAYMFEKDYWAHTAPDGTGPWAFFNQAGYAYTLAGENLAKDFNDSSGVVQGLMNSETHRANILHGGYTEIGFAVANGKLLGSDTTLVVQLFGQPSRAIAKTVRKVEAATVTEKEPIPITVVPTQIPEKIETGTTMDTSGGTLAGLSSKQTLGVTLQKILADSTYVTLFVLALAVVLDIYYAYRLNLFRLAGKNMAHFMVLIVAIISFILFTKGALI